MRNKITGVLVCTLLIAIVFCSAFGGTVNIQKNKECSQSSYVIITERNFGNNIKNNSQEFLNETDIKPCTFFPRKIKIDDTEFIYDHQMPENPGERPLIYKPPWENNWWDKEKETWGTGDAGYKDANTDPYYGFVDDMYASTAPYGTASMTIWLDHYFIFIPSVSDTYSLTFKYIMQGHAARAFDPWGGIGSAVSNVKAWFFVGNEKEVEIQVYYEEGETLGTPFVWSDTISISADLDTGYGYGIEAQGGLKTYVSCALCPGASSHIWTKGDHHRLKEVTIDWPNHPPRKILGPSGSNELNEGQEGGFACFADDPDGIGDKLWYKWDWGDGTNSGWLGPYPAWTYNDWAKVSHSWDKPGTYDVKVKAKDTSGETTDWSDTLYVNIRSNPPNEPSITGSVENLKPNKEYIYKFRSTDPDGDKIYYLIDWGDGSNVKLGPFGSGEEIEGKHSWAKKNTDYNIRAKAEDIHGEESDWSTLRVSTPKDYNPIGFWMKILDRFPILRNIVLILMDILRN